MTEATSRFILTRNADLPSNVSERAIRRSAIAFVSPNSVEAAVNHWSHLLAIAANVPGKLLCISPSPHLALELLEAFTEATTTVVSPAELVEFSTRASARVSQQKMTLDGFLKDQGTCGSILPYDTVLIDSLLASNMTLQDNLIKELPSLMSRGGLLVLGTQNPIRLENVWRLANGETNDRHGILPYADSEIVPEISVRTISDQLRESGFSILESYTTDIMTNETTGSDRLSIVLMHREHTLGQMSYLAARKDY
jgi:hypothetical protein